MKKFQDLLSSLWQNIKKTTTGVARLLKPLQEWFKKLPLEKAASGAKRLGSLVLGSYTPAPWMNFLFKLPAKAARAAKATLGRLPKALRFSAAGLGAVYLLVMVCATPGVKMNVTSPGPTNIEQNQEPDPMVIYFSEPAASLDQLNKEVTEGIKLEPEIKGTWRWRNEQTLVFTPAEEWKIGKKYEVQFDKDFFPEHLKIDSYQTRFSSASFSASTETARFYQDPYNPKIHKAVTTIKFTHPVNPDELKKRVHVKIAPKKKKGILSSSEKNLSFTVEFNKSYTQAYIHSEKLAITLDKQIVTIKVDSGVPTAGGEATLASKLTTTVEVPDLETLFHVKESRVVLVKNKNNATEQTLVIATSSGISPKALLKKIKVYLLPVDRHSGKGLPVEKDFDWQIASQVTPETLKKAKRLKLIPTPPAYDYPTLNSFIINVPVGRKLYLLIPKGLESIGGYELVRNYAEILKVPEYPKEVRIAQRGSLLSLSGEKRILITARDQKALHYEIAKIKPADIAHFITQSYYGSKFNNPEFQNRSYFNESNITQLFEKTLPMDNSTPGQLQYASFDFSKYLQLTGVKHGLFIFTVSSYDPVNKRKTGLKDRRLVMVTNLGIIKKHSSDGTSDFFIQSLATGQPAGGVQVTILGKNGLAVRSGVTDYNGHVKLKSTKGLKREKNPTVVIARQGNDLSFLPWSAGERNLSYHRFDVGGERIYNTKSNLYAYLFSDRGVYRPGDRFHIGAIIKSRKWTPLPAGLPLEAVITDPRGVEIERKSIKLSAQGFEELSYKTSVTSPTGEYTITLYVVQDKKNKNRLGSTRVKVEEFIPDTMRIRASIASAPEKGWLKPGDIKALVNLSNLYGTPAAGHTIASFIHLSPVLPSFAGYRDYHFFDPLKPESGFSERLPEVKANDKGEAKIPLNLVHMDTATYRLSYTAEGRALAGGRSVSASASVIVSPLDFILGYKPEGNLSYIKKDKQMGVHVVALNSKLKRVSTPLLTLELVERRYVSALTRQNDGTYRYQSVEKIIPVSSKKVKIGAKGYHYQIAGKKAGNFRVRFLDSKNTALSEFSYTVAGQGDTTGSMEKNAELQVKLNKSDFNPGEMIELFIRAPYTGAGLITIEREKVYSYHWFTTSTNSSIQYIQVPPNLEGNAYVNVTFLRNLDSKEIYTSPLSFAAMPFSINRKARMAKISLNTPSVVKPGQKLNIQYNTDRAGKIVVFAIDEGILQVAGYKTPKPLDFFFKKRALQVTTSQILDLLMPEFSIFRKLSAPGGGEGAEALLDKKLNPFQAKGKKPVAYWSGILSASAGKGSVSYRVPDHFNGSLRVMAVFISGSAIGVARKNTLSRGDFIITPNTPRFVAPKDQFEISATITNNLKGKEAGSKISVSAKATGKGLLKIEKGAAQNITVKPGKTGVVRFDLRALKRLGPAKITITASQGKKSTSYEVDLSVRPAIPYRTKIQSGYVKSGKKNIDISRLTLPDLKKTELSLSNIPLGLGKGLTNYLQSFPYGCTEQLTSRTIPSMVFYNNPEFGYNRQENRKNLDHTIEILKSRQNRNGSFGFWSASSYASDFQSLYVMHFLTDLKETGYPVPYNLYSRSLGYTKTIAEKHPSNLRQARESAYAIYLLTRNGALTSNLLSSLFDTVQSRFKKKYPKDLTAIFLGASYQLLKQKEKGSSVFGKLKIDDPVHVDYGHFYDELSRNAVWLYILARHFPDRLTLVKEKEMLKLLEPIFQNKFNTISSAYTLMALSAYAKATKNETGKFKLTQTLNSKQKELKFKLQKSLVLAYPDHKASRVSITPEHQLPWFYQLTEGGYDTAPPAKAIKNGLEIHREFRNEEGESLTEAKVGELLTVRVSLRSISDRKLSNIAVMDLLPGGFEIDLPSLRKSRSVSSGGNYIWGFPQYFDARDDRVLIFGDVHDRAVTFVYKVRAISPGTFQIPPLFAESMYNREIWAMNTAETFKITPDKNE